MTVKRAPQALTSPLAKLYSVKQKSIADGKNIFDLVMQEAADRNALEGIVYQESLLQLILYVLDHRKDVSTWANQIKSAKKRTESALVNKGNIADWCNDNPEKARLPYKISVQLAMAETDVSASTSVRDYISDWRKSHPKKKFSA
jgi:hypothetical protein